MQRLVPFVAIFMLHPEAQSFFIFLENFKSQIPDHFLSQFACNFRNLRDTLKKQDFGNPWDRNDCSST
jgi:hypothetical protein